MGCWSDCKENWCQSQDMLTNFKAFTICVNHNEQHNGGLKSSMNLKLINSKLLIARNHSVFMIFQKFKMD
jgi:hypothetical protein